MLSNRSRGVATALLIVVALSGGAGAVPVQERQMDDEQQIGQQTFEELKSKGEIIASSPLYDQLTPIATAIIKTAQPRYGHPFKFYLVHERQPNAFATPGGNIY